MAIGANSIVSPRTAGLGLNVNGPLFGIVESGAGPFTVLWYNGERVASIVVTNLDEILASGGTQGADFVGRQVKVNNPVGQTNYGLFTCVASYNRNGSEVLLLKNNVALYFIEALASQCSASP